MTKYIAFLRAINVGGHTVKMDTWRGLFESLGFSNAETFTGTRQARAWLNKSPEEQRFNLFVRLYRSRINRRPGWVTHLIQAEIREGIFFVNRRRNELAG